MHTILVNYSEIILKGKNRPYFERALKENIRKSADRTEVQLEAIKRDGASFICTFFGDKELVIKSLKYVFGIKQFLFVKTMSKELDKILEEMQNSLYKIKKSGAKTVSFNTKRSDKNFPLTSPKLNEKFGEIANNEGLKVDYSDKENIIYIKIGEKSAYISFEKINACGGLPVGTAGKVLVLLSGGIDSPVAAWSLMKRGVHCDFLHIHNFRKNEDVISSKIPETIKMLNNYQFKSTLYISPYIPFELTVMGKVPSKYELVLFKHYILRLAQEIAKKNGYLAIANGDSLAQVASQTLENINATQCNINLPVFRPLLSSDKEDIICTAKKIGTYELSIEKYKDCCSLVSKNPATRSKREKLESLLDNIYLEKLISNELSKIKTFKI